MLFEEIVWSFIETDDMTSQNALPPGVGIARKMGAIDQINTEFGQGSNLSCVH